MSSTNYQLSDFARDVESRYVASRPETLWLCGQSLARLMASDSVAAALNAQVRQLVSDPHFLGDWAAQSVCLHRATAWTLSIAILDSPRRYIHALPEFAYYAPIGVDSLTADRYALPAAYRNELFDSSVKLEPSGMVQTSRGEPMPLETDKFAYDFRAVRVTPIVRLMTGPVRPMEWLFSKTTLQAWQANDADIAFTQLRVAAYVLGKLAHQSSVGPLKSLASHPHHAVRWAAIQNLGRLNRSEALVKIRDAINDPHPHVRKAAQKTLDQLEKRSAR